MLQHVSVYEETIIREPQSVKITHLVKSRYVEAVRPLRIYF